MADPAYGHRVNVAVAESRFARGVAGSSGWCQRTFVGYSGGTLTHAAGDDLCSKTTMASTLV